MRLRVCRGLAGWRSRSGWGWRWPARPGRRLPDTLGGFYGVVNPGDVALSPDGSRIYVTNFDESTGAGTVSVIAFAPA